MSNAISSAHHAQQAAHAAQVTQTAQPKPAPKQNATQSASREDKVTISSAARAASQAAQNQQAGSDGDQDTK
ncbi:MAG TPA: hypothetical protein VG322_03585 [Candidatus Acidoferrales bacterium]|nr:hypothetical protein [Candidatus Acidoferrales bacterium]